MKRGQRTIDVRVYSLGGRVTGVNAKSVAKAEATAKRVNDMLVRIVKLSETDYLIYEI